MIRSAQEVIDIAERRGFKVLVKPGPPPMPYLLGKENEATPVLLDALKAWRVEIIELLNAREASFAP